MLDGNFKHLIGLQFCNFCSDLRDTERHKGYASCVLQVLAKTAAFDRAFDTAKVLLGFYDVIGLEIKDVAPELGRRSRKKTPTTHRSKLLRFPLS